MVVTRNMQMKKKTKNVNNWIKFYLFLTNKYKNDDTISHYVVDHHDDADDEDDTDDDDDTDDEDDDEDEDDTDDEDDEDDDEFNFDNDDIRNQIILCLNMTNVKKRKNDDTNDDLLSNKQKKLFDNKSYKKTLSDIELQYYNSLDKTHQNKIVDMYNSIKFNNNDVIDIPLNFKIMNSNMDIRTKHIALMNYEQLNCMLNNSSEYFKLQKWLYGLCNIPFGIYRELPVNYTSDKKDIKSFLEYTINGLDEHVYGHKEAKHQIIRTIGKWISNPFAEGNVIGIHGKPGVGKTTLIKDGLSKCLNLPFAFIPLGGATDSSHLDGHNYTYEGSTWGKIVDVVMKSQCMNPIIYFDELDKISNTDKGEEITNLLIHLTDPVQNTHFNDKYFLNTPLDLSKALIIFTYNNSNHINPILKDRLITIHTSDYNLNDKIHIATNHLIPNILQSFSINQQNITISNENLSYLIKNTTDEAGVRNLKRSIELIISNINLNNLLEQNMEEYPIDINKKLIDIYIKKTQVDTLPTFMYM